MPGASLVNQVDLQLQAREEMLQLLKHHLRQAQERMKVQADKHRVDRQFKIGDLVYLKLQPYRQNSLADRQYRKLSARYFGPYRVEDKIGAVAYRLTLPAGSQIHPIFHVSQLKRKLGSGHLQGSQLPVYGSSPTLEPLAVLDRRMVQRGNRPATQVLIHWTNSFPEDATWEFLFDLQQKFPSFEP